MSRLGKRLEALEAHNREAAPEIYTESLEETARWIERLLSGESMESSPQETPQSPKDKEMHVLLNERLLGLDTSVDD